MDANSQWPSTISARCIFNLLQLRHTPCTLPLQLTWLPLTQLLFRSLLLLLTRVLHPNNMQFIPLDTELLARSSSNTPVLRKCLMGYNLAQSTFKFA
jgi:hypothetical protein